MRRFKTSLLEYAESNNLPYLLEEYDSSNPLPPSEIGCNSTLAVQWTCAHGHTVTESVQKRIRRGYCSVCGPNGAGSFAQKHPEMLKYWSGDNHVSPHDIPPNYSKNIVWICPKGHTWQRKIPLQLKLKSCPICKSSLFLQAPELLKEWDKEGNKGIDTNTVYRTRSSLHH